MAGLFTRKVIQVLKRQDTLSYFICSQDARLSWRRCGPVTPRSRSSLSFHRGTHTMCLCHRPILIPWGKCYGWENVFMKLLRIILRGEWLGVWLFRYSCTKRSVRSWFPGELKYSLEAGGCQCWTLTTMECLMSTEYDQNRRLNFLAAFAPLCNEDQWQCS